MSRRLALTPASALRIRAQDRSHPWSLQWTSQSTPRRAPCPFRKSSMTAFLTLDSISLATPDGRPLFDGLTLAIGRERTGAVGGNAGGKSRLWRASAGE